MVIYLDVLLLSNWWIDYFLLKTVSHMTHTPTGKWRLPVAAGIGAFTSLLIFLPPVLAVLTWIIRIGSAILMCVIAFMPCPCRRLLQTSLYLFASALIFCGVIYTIGNLIAPNGVMQANGVLYADVSLGVLLMGTAVGSLIATYTARKRQQTDTTRYQIRVELQNGSYQLQAFCDSGNTLCDPFSGLPVILCNARCLRTNNDTPQTAQQIAQQQKGFRMLQVNTVTGNKLLPACLPESIIIYDRNKAYPVKAVLAVSDESIPGLFPPVLLP